MAEAKTVDVPGTDLDTVDEATRNTVTDVAQAIRDLNTPGSAAIYSSINAATFEDRIRIVSALSGSESADDNKGAVINLKDFVIQAVDITDDNGVTNKVPRVVLIDEDGTAFHATSVGIFSAIENLIAIVGEPSTWEKSIPTVVVEQKTRKGFKVLTLQYV